jgi:hypothetical protein
LPLPACANGRQAFLVEGVGLASHSVAPAEDMDFSHLCWLHNIIKWKIQPQQRSRSWLSSISNARIEIDDLLEDEPSLRPKVHEIWNKCFKAAKQLAQDETGIEPTIDELPWEEVFEEEYFL